MGPHQAPLLYDAGVYTTDAGTYTCRYIWRAVLGAGGARQGALRWRMVWPGRRIVRRMQRWRGRRDEVEETTPHDNHC